MRRGLLVACALWVGVLPLSAQAPSERTTVRAFVRPEGQIRDSAPFELVLQIDGAGKPQVSLPAFRGTADLRLVGGPNHTSQMSFVNGQVTSTFQLTYVLVATRPGRFEIPALALEIDGKAYRTAPLAVQVSAAGSAAPPGAARAPDSVFLEARLGQDDVWVGEPVALTVTLLASRAVSDPSWVSRPSFDRFWSETIEIQNDREPQRRRIGEQTFAAYPVDHKVLVAPGPGTYTIEPYVLQLRAATRSGDVFDLFSFGLRETIVRKSEPLSLHVRQLPPGAPPDFGGAVGRYTLAVALDRDRAAVDDAVALRATVEGTGVLQAVDAPALQAPAEVKLFEPKVTEATTKIGDTIRSRKTWEWILVPLRPGDLRLPDLRFPFFDPATERYEVLSSSPGALAVERGAAGDAPRVARGAIQLEGRDLAYLKDLDGRLLRHKPPVHERGGFRALVALPVLLVPALVIVGRRHARRRQDRGQVRARRALGRARSRLRGVRRRLVDADPTAFHEDLARALVEYAADRLDRSAAGMTYDEADALLAARGVDDALRRRFRTCLESCDFARFVPAASRTERRTELFEDATTIVEALERAW